MSTISPSALGSRSRTRLKPLPFLDLSRMSDEVREEVLAGWAELTSTGQFVGGDAVTRFEEDWAAFCGTRFAVARAPENPRWLAEHEFWKSTGRRLGLPVEFAVAGYPNRRFTGRVNRVNPTADPATRQVRIFVTIPNAGADLEDGEETRFGAAADHPVALAFPEGEYLKGLLVLKTG